MKNLAVAVSGQGTLLEAMIEDGIPIKLVLADRLCRGVEVASKANIPTVQLPRPLRQLTFDERHRYTLEFLQTLQSNQIDLLAMAGFMTILAPVIFQHYHNRIINSHPSMLPDFKGAHAVRDALAAKVKWTGTTIHYATEELDAGELITRRAVCVLPNDTEETLHERIKEVERKLYPKVLRDLL